MLRKRSAVSEKEGEEEKEERKDKCSCDCSVAEKRRREGGNANERTNEKVVPLCSVALCTVVKKKKGIASLCTATEKKWKKFAGVVVITFLCPKRKWKSSLLLLLLRSYAVSNVVEKEDKEQVRRCKWCDYYARMRFQLWLGFVALLM